MDKQITIRMPKELLAKWLAALRSGEYPQTTAQTMRDETGYCCLGVLVAANGDDPDAHVGTPSQPWVEDNGVTFGCANGQPAILNNPYLPTIGLHATCANDQGMPFPEIADAIEACSEGY